MSVILYSMNSMNQPRFISLFLKGIAIGTAAIIPGISGGTIAVMLGIYKELISAIVNLTKAWRTSLQLLIPVGLGAVTAIIALSYPMTLAFTYAPLPTVSLFAGLIIGSLPKLRKDLPKVWSFSQWILVILPALIAISLGVFSVVGSLDATDILVSPQIFPKMILLVIGALGVSAFIVPGISGSMLLLSIGFYEPILNSLNRLVNQLFQWQEMVPEVINFTFLGLGALVGFFSISLLMKFLFEKHRLAVSLSVFGFILGSLFSVYYNYEIVSVYSSISLIVIAMSLLTLGLGARLSFQLNRYDATR
jgi:putative membrane protein